MSASRGGDSRPAIVRAEEGADIVRNTDFYADCATQDERLVEGLMLLADALEELNQRNEMEDAAVVWDRAYTRVNGNYVCHGSDFHSSIYRDFRRIRNGLENGDIYRVDEAIGNAMSALDEFTDTERGAIGRGTSGAGMVARCAIISNRDDAQTIESKLEEALSMVTDYEDAVAIEQGDTTAVCMMDEG